MWIKLIARAFAVRMHKVWIWKKSYTELIPLILLDKLACAFIRGICTYAILEYWNLVVASLYTLGFLRFMGHRQGSRDYRLHSYVCVVFLICFYHHNPIDARAKLIVFSTFYNKGELVQNTHLIYKQFCSYICNQISIQNNWVQILNY